TGVGAVAVLAGPVAVPLLTLPGDDGGGPAGQSPSPPAEASFGFTMAFYDLRHGVAVYQPDDCRLHVSTTQDGGATWSELRPVPELPGAVLDFSGEPGCRLDRVIPIAPGKLVLPLDASTLARDEWVEPLTSALISHDAGQTWQELEPETRTADVVPDGVVPQPHCLADPCQETRLGWYDPQTGNPTLLRNNPLAATPNAVASVTADGTIWVSGTDAEDGYLVSVSRDRGHTWQDGSPGRADEVGPDDWVMLAASDGQTAYVGNRPSDTTSQTGATFRTVDGGQTWRRLAGQPALDRAEAMWASPDGTLAVHDAGARTHLSTDLGETFQENQLLMLDVERIVGGFFGWHQGDPTGAAISGALSEDGVHWQLFPVPGPPPAAGGPAVSD
ncbi:MAG: sialidase family protein, partial [Natronosporangium sp.]